MNNGASAVDAVAHDTREAIEICLSQEDYYDLIKITWMLVSKEKIKNTQGDWDHEGKMCLPQGDYYSYFKAAMQKIGNQINKISEPYNRGAREAEERQDFDEAKRQMEARECAILDLMRAYPYFAQLYIRSNLPKIPPQGELENLCKIKK